MSPTKTTRNIVTTYENRRNRPTDRNTITITIIVIIMLIIPENKYNCWMKYPWARFVGLALLYMREHKQATFRWEKEYGMLRQRRQNRARDRNEKKNVSRWITLLYKVKKKTFSPNLFYARRFILLYYIYYKCAAHTNLITYKIPHA